MDVLPPNRPPAKWKRIALYLLGAAALGFIALVLAVLYLISPKRDAEVALGVGRLPWSARNLLISRDVWTDYVVRGYVELSPADFEKMIKARPYSRYENHPRTLKEEPLPPGRTLVATRSYLWNAGEVSFCNLKADESRTWIWFAYSTD